MIIRAASLLAVVALGVLAACDSGPKTRAASGATATVAVPPAAVAPTPAPAASGTSLGAGVKLAESTSIDALLADPKAYAGKTVRVEGMIVDVCPKRGCWMDLAGSGAGQKLRFKVVDGEMVFPLEAKGKYALAEGVVAVNELSLEETKEYVAYQHREYGAKRDPATVTEPMSIVRLDGTGAVLRDQR
jgi:Domain of unknown function (DUF4920)